MQRIERPKSLVEMATEAIRRQIVSGELTLGEKISEGKVAERLGLSTTPVREAFQKLAIEGLVTIIAQKGTYVFDLNPGDLNQLCEARLAIEPAALQLAYDRERERLISNFESIVARMESALAGGRVTDYLDLDTDFHGEIINRCGNAYLQKAYDVVGWKVSALRVRLGTDQAQIRKSFAEHKAILSHLKKSDLVGALGILPGHIARKEGSYWEHLDKKWTSLLINAANPLERSVNGQRR